MMRWPAPALVLCASLALTACLDTTSADPLVDGRVAHAIPGAGPAFVSVNLTPTFQLQPLDFNYFVVTATARTYDIEVAGQTLRVDVQHDRDITAIVLLDLDGPALRTYDLDHQPGAQRIAIINAYGAAGDLEIIIAGVEDTFDATVAPGEAGLFEPFQGDFSVRVRGADDAEFYDLEPFSLVEGDHGFLLIVPGPGPAQPYRTLLF